MTRTIDAEPRARHRRRHFTPAVVVLVALATLVGASAVGPGPVAGAAPRAAATPVAVQPAAAVPSPGAAEAEFVALINQLRASRGLGALSVDAELTGQARSWAGTMAGQGRIFHAGDLSVGISSNWQKLGENVGVGGVVGPLFQAFIDSPAHLANLVDPGYSRVGVGVVTSGDRIFTTHRFMSVAAPAPPPPPPAPAVTAPPITAAPAAPPPTAAPTTAAPTTSVPPPPSTTTTVAPRHKLGPVERIAGLISRP